MNPENDFIILAPGDIDLARSPLANADLPPTYVLGAFNPGLTRLPGGNLLMMVRIAEALRQPIEGNRIRTIRWDPSTGFTTDAYDLSMVDATDPRKFRLLDHTSKVMALTSLSWLLPVELSPKGNHIVTIHYDKAIVPAAGYQEYGVEDARISRIEGRYYMTTCSVSPERHSTTLYTSENGLDYELRGIILDHQNKDMLFFEGLPLGKFHALTRPLGDLYFSYPPSSPHEAGPSINLAVSPDGLHWKPVEKPFIRPRRGSASVMRIGGGSPPILTPRGWLMLYHGVQPGTVAGIYRTFHAFLDAEDPSIVLSCDDEEAVLEARPDLSALTGSSTLNVSRDLYIAEYGSTTLSLLDHSALFVGTQLNQNSGGTITIDLSGWIPSQDTIITANSTSINGGILNLFGLETLGLGETMILIDSETANAIGKYWTTLQVEGVAQSLSDYGDGLFVFTYNSNDYLLNYRDGSDNSNITLSIVPEPSASTLLVSGFSAMLLLGRGSRMAL